MNILSGIKAIFSSTKTVDNVFDKENGLLTQMGGWIGNMNYTDEERAEAIAKATGAVIDYAKATMSESTERSRTRRTIAVRIIEVELFLVLSCVVAWPFNEKYAAFIWQIVSSDLMFWAFASINIFFFGTYGVGQHLLKAKK